VAKNSKTKRPDKIIPKARPGGEARTTGVKGRTQSPSEPYPSPPVRRKKFRRPGTSIAEAFEHAAKID